MLAPLHFPEFLRDDPLSERSLLALATLTKVTVDIKLYSENDAMKKRTQSVTLCNFYCNGILTNADVI